MARSLARSLVLRFPEYISLWRTLVAQEFAVRYRGTLLGRSWPLLMPLMLLGIYGFVFGTIFRARWPGLADDDHLGFSLNLFMGLLIHGLLAETVGSAPGLMQRNVNFVSKVVFPLPLLVAVPIGTALIHMAFGLVLVLLINGMWGQGWYVSAIALPLILLPYVLMLYGLSLVFSALGVYVRDLTQITAVLVMLALFTGTVFFPRDMVPGALLGIVDYNPITWPIEAARGAVLLGRWPDPAAMGVYTLAALGVTGFGAYVFSILRRGFADVL